MIKIIFFDFDGTIANTKNIYYNAIINNLKEKGFSEKEVLRIINLGLNLKSSLDRIGLSFFSKWVLNKKIIKDLRSNFKDIDKCKGLTKIKEIKNKILVSNSKKSLIIPILINLKIKNYFMEIYGSEDFSEKGKFLIEYIKHKKVLPQECCYVGDRAADVRVAKDIKCKSIIISNKCSWNSKKEIKSERPDFIIKDLSEVRKIISILNS